MPIPTTKGRVALERYASISTMFIEGDPSLDVSADGPLRLNVKSIALLYQAARVAARTRSLRAGPIVDQSTQLLSLRQEAHALNIGLPAFIRTLEIQAQPHGPHFAMLASVLTKALGASMELHSIDAMSDPGSYNAMIEAAMTIAKIAHETEAVDSIALGPLVGVSDENSIV